MKNQRVTRRLTAAVVLTFLSLAAMTAGVGTAGGAAAANLNPALCAPGQNSFTLDINNPFFPLQVGQQWTYFGKDQGQSSGLHIRVLDQTEGFKFKKGVTTRVVVETEWEDADEDGVVDADEALIEVSRNYFAQTRGGTVCYFGEDVKIYENGVFLGNTEGSWRADAKGNAPGIFMPTRSLIDVGVTFQQEIAPGVAEDQATIVATGVTVKVPAGTFEGSIKVRDFNPLDGSRGFKWYAPEKVGLVVDGPLNLVSY